MLQHILYDRKKFITAGVIIFGLVPILIVSMGSTPASSMMDSSEAGGVTKKNERPDSRTNSESKANAGQTRQTDSADRDRRTDTNADRQNRDGEQKRGVRDDNQTSGSGNKANNDGQTNRQHSYSHHHHSQSGQQHTDEHGCASGYSSSQNHCTEVKNRDTVTHQPAETTKKTTTAAETTNKTQVVHHHYQAKQSTSEKPKQTRYRPQTQTENHYHYNTTNRYVTNQQAAPKPPEPAQHTTYNVHNYSAPAPTTASTSTGNTSSTVHHVHHNQRVASASTTYDSDNGKTYTDRLPDTGPSEVAKLSGMAAVFGTLGHWLYVRRKNS